MDCRTVMIGSYSKERPLALELIGTHWLQQHKLGKHVAVNIKGSIKRVFVHSFSQC